VLFARSSKFKPDRPWGSLQRVDRGQCRISLTNEVLCRTVLLTSKLLIEDCSTTVKNCNCPLLLFLFSATCFMYCISHPNSTSSSPADTVNQMDYIPFRSSYINPKKAKTHSFKSTGSSSGGSSARSGGNGQPPPCPCCRGHISPFPIRTRAHCPVDRRRRIEDGDRERSTDVRSTVCTDADFLSDHIRSPEAQEGLRARGLTSIGWEKYPNLILPPAFSSALLTRL
jgi:hypothetical protein